LEQVNGTSSRLSSFLGHAYEDSLHLVDFVTLMEMGPFVPPPEKGVAIDPRQSPRIEFREVSFAYPGGKRVLHHISFVIEPGESIALVGQNGAGKSTIINLLCRFYDAEEGQILINDIDIREIELASWYKALGTLFQNYVQYHFTIRENIAFENASAARLEDLQDAAQKSGAQDFIQKLPAAYEQQLGKEFEKGEELSGGQWQKLAIARAFYNQPPVLILDEPTSAIDAEAEYQIFNNLEQTYQDKSLILVSHRFSTVRNADKIYVIEEGRIIEQGNHEALLAQKGKYAEMFYLQAEGYL
ncbi:MAG: ATP-binding cassette domain-containing protein, partial [Bacteroidota bacterium]